MRQPRVPAGSGPPTSPSVGPISARPQIHQIVLPLTSDGASSAAPNYVQVYLIDSAPLTLIDTGTRLPDSRAALEAALEGHGHGLAEIERVIVTHAHRDHMGLVQSIRDAGADLECLVHEADAAVVESFVEDVERRVIEMTPLFREFGVPEEELDRLETQCLEALAVDAAEAEPTRVDRVLRDGDRIAWKDFTLDVRHSPGHTPGHILLEDESIGLLMTGDQIMGQAVPYAENFYQSALPDPRDPLLRRKRFRGLVELRKSLKSLRGRPFQVLLPGYGGVIRRPDRAIRETLLHYEVRLQRIDRGLRHLADLGQDVTAYEVWKALFGTASTSESTSEARSQILMVIGALDCLEEDGTLVTERRADGVLTHHHR